MSKILRGIIMLLVFFSVIQLLGISHRSGESWRESFVRELSAFENSLVSHSLPDVQTELVTDIHVASITTVASKEEVSSIVKLSPTIEDNSSSDIKTPDEAAALSSSDNAHKRPNVLFILADDLRPQLGLYNHKAITPNLDMLSASGVTFERAHAQITVCNPSRASILSGRRPDTTEIFGFEAATPLGWTTLPAYFRKSGYTSFGVGKIFHWGPGPTDAWTPSVKLWADTRSNFRNDTKVHWQTPFGGSPSVYLEESELLRPKGPPFHVAYWPNSAEFLALKGREQKCLKSTVQFESESEQAIKGEERGTLPFRDGIFANRAIRLMEVANAQDKPWFLAVGFSLPHEPIRFPEWVWEATDSNFELSPPSIRPRGSPIFALGDIKEKFTYRDGRRINVQRDYGPKKSKAFLYKDTQPDAIKVGQLSEAQRHKMRQDYQDRVTASSKGKNKQGVEVRGDDMFGSMSRSVWADLENDIMERPMPADAREELAHGYTAAISFLDYQVGRVLAALKELPKNANENTLIVFTADHGFSLGDHGSFGKRTLWDTDTRVPLIVRPPPVATSTTLRGVRHADRLIELVDLFPTLIEYAGLTDGVGVQLFSEPPLEGTSFAPLLRESGAMELPEKKFVFSQFPRCPVRVNRKNEQKCLLQEPWRTSGAGGFECQGRAADWTTNHDLALMGYSMRSHQWRYTAWLRVVGYRQASVPLETESSWQHNNLIVNWSYPPYFEELFDHRADFTKRGRIYYDENLNIAYDTPGESFRHFEIMKQTFDNGLLPH